MSGDNPAKNALDRLFGVPRTGLTAATSVEAPEGYWPVGDQCWACKRCMAMIPRGRSDLDHPNPIEVHTEWHRQLDQHEHMTLGVLG